MDRAALKESYNSALVRGFEAIHVDLHRTFDRMGVARRDEINRELGVRERATLLAREVEDLRRRVALLSHVERAPQLGDDEL
jgi:glycerophosphoryl diester phosphodiesterase